MSRVRPSKSGQKYVKKKLTKQRNRHKRLICLEIAAVACPDFPHEWAHIFWIPIKMYILQLIQLTEHHLLNTQTLFVSIQSGGCFADELSHTDILTVGKTGERKQLTLALSHSCPPVVNWILLRPQGVMHQSAKFPSCVVMVRGIQGSSVAL